jgi:hypothetical protein
MVVPVGLRIGIVLLELGSSDIGYVFNKNTYASYLGRKVINGLYSSFRYWFLIIEGC